MPFNVSAFRTQIALDGARPNLFEVLMPFPSWSGGVLASVPMTFMCKSAQLPGSTIGTATVPYFGREIKLPGNRTFQDWSVTIINDETFIIRTAFERWMHGINSHENNLRRLEAVSSLGYSQDARVIQYGKAGVPLREYNFVGMFPTDIAPIDLDWGSNDTVEEFSVTLTYQWWESVTIGVV